VFVAVVIATVIDPRMDQADDFDDLSSTTDEILSESRPGLQPDVHRAGGYFPPHAHGDTCSTPSRSTATLIWYPPPSGIAVPDQPLDPA